ncbi:MAG: TadE/TadG family type IV pilus assembly protein [Mariniblastus sp.]
MKTSKSKRQERRGALTVEVALCLPILLMTLFGCFELAHANMLLHATESAAYEGARIGIIPGATEQKIQDAASGVLRTVGINNFTITVTPSVITTETEAVSVNIEVPFRGNTSLPTFFITNPVFRGNCELSREIL